MQTLRRARKWGVGVPLYAAIVALGVPACGSLPMRGADPESLHSSTLIEACPLGVRGTHIEARETNDGVDVFFSSRPASVEDVRLRVRDQARVNGEQRHQGRGHLGEHNGARGHGLRLWTMPPLRTSVEDTTYGAKLHVAAVDPQRRLEVRDALVSRVAKLDSAECF